MSLTPEFVAQIVAADHIIFEISKWSIDFYRAFIFTRKFNSYMVDRIPLMFAAHTRVTDIGRCKFIATLSDDTIPTDVRDFIMLLGNISVIRVAHNRVHSVDQPAVVFKDGSQFWCQYDVLHRAGRSPADEAGPEGPSSDGPAVILKQGEMELDMERDDFNRMIQKVKAQRDGYILDDNSANNSTENDIDILDLYKYFIRCFTKVRDSVYDCVWYQYAYLARQSIIPADPQDIQMWYQHGNLHRVGKPAIVFPDAELWYQDGQLHRSSGPSEHGEGGPAAIHGSGHREYRQYGVRHREDGPAVITADLTLYWYRHGVQHRDDGPAVVRTRLRSHNSWYRNGRLIAPPRRFLGLFR